MNKTIPKELQLEVDKYFNLDFGDRPVRCPYYINTKFVSGNLRVMAGKGTAEEIELETRVWAKVKGFDLQNATEQEIRNFMMKMKIGIDCSGFIVQVLNNFLMIRGNKQLWKYLKFQDNSFIARLRRSLRPVENIGANLLTSELNCEAISDLNEVQPGDFIRAKGKQKNAHHVALITEVEYQTPPTPLVSGERIAKRIKYVNSHRFYEDQNGVRYGEIEITDPNGELKDQEFNDTLNGRNYFYEDLMEQYDDNGIRRLRFAEEIFRR